MKGIAFLLIALFFCYACGNKRETKREKAGSDLSFSTSAATPKPGQWMDSIEKIAKTDSCGMKLANQIKYLQNEKHSAQYSFENYRVADSLTVAPAKPDLNSSRSARMFKTKITEGLRDSGINFAGYYSIVDVPMTGWGSNFWIIDRRTGRVFEFPYKTNYLRFKKESNLIIMDPKETILNNLKEMDDFHNACVYQYSVSGQMFTDLRPFYFTWKNNQLKTLAGPPGEQPLLNSFWKEFFENK